MAIPTLRRSAAVLVLALGACASAPPPAAPAFDAAAAIAAVRAAGAPQAGELEVQPLRDPQVDDLRQQAAQLEARQDYRGAAGLVDRALALQPADAQDSEMLQQRAELALLLRDPAGAEGFARKAIALGPATGPLCRRHWETVLQAALVRANDRVVRPGESEAQASARVGEAAAQVRQARAQREACTVTAPKRY
jgi:hypothetical protein